MQSSFSALIEIAASVERIGVCVTRTRNLVSLQRGEPSDGGARRPALSVRSKNRRSLSSVVADFSFYISNFSILGPISQALGVETNAITRPPGRLV